MRPQFLQPALGDREVSTDQGSCTAKVSFTAVAEDNCSVATISGNHASGDEFPLGTTTVTLIAKDEFDNSTDNSSNCTF